MTRRETPYADPYLAGAALGLVLLATFVITGRGLGASGAFATTAAGLTNAIAPQRAANSAFFSRYLDQAGSSEFLGVPRSSSATTAGSTPRNPRNRGTPRNQWQWRDWLLFELIGVMVGGFLSALLAGRLRRDVERGPRISARSRLALAFVGGSAMGLGAVLARGCTSGLGLTGGALLSVGSWIFIGAAFAGAYALSPLLRKAWR
jgi:uncharacterized membrane protein YedE/YeeE